jgi:hypothetical protein
MASRLMLNLREAYASNGETTVETRDHEMHFYRSILRGKTRPHTTFNTSWALDSSRVCRPSFPFQALALTIRIQDFPTVPSGVGYSSYHSPTILEEGPGHPLPPSIQATVEKAGTANQEPGLDMFEGKQTSSLDDTERGAQEKLDEKAEERRADPDRRPPLAQVK